MANNLKYEDPTLQVYEALAIIEEKNEEIERLQRENEKLRGGLQGYSVASPGTSNAEGSLSQGHANNEASLTQQNNDSNLSIPSFDEQVKQALEAITQVVNGLRSSVRDLTERDEEISSNCRINQVKLEGKFNEVTRELNEKMDKIQHKMNADAEQNRNRYDELVRLLLGLCVQQPPHQAQILDGSQEPLTSEMLAQAAPQEQKQLLGERIYALINKMYPGMEEVGKITGMMLEIDNSELIMMLSDKDTFRSKVDEANAVLQQSAFKNV